MLALCLSLLVFSARTTSKFSHMAMALLTPLLFLWGIVKVIGLTFLGIFKTCWPVWLCFKQNLENKVIVVTGGGNGLGARLADRLAELGAKVAIWDIDRVGMDSTCSMVERKGGIIKGYLCDVCSFEQVKRIGLATEQELGPVDILINNAGIAYRKSIYDLNETQIEKTVRTNLIAQFWTVKQFLPGMTARNSGLIVCIASIAGVVGTANLSDYCASKFGIVGMMEALTIELKNRNVTGVRTLTVCPYFIRSRMFEGIHTRYQFVLPMLDEDKTARKIIQAMRAWQEILYLPKSSYFLLSLKGILPARALAELGYLFGAHTAMEASHSRLEGNSALQQCPLVTTV